MVLQELRYQVLVGFEPDFFHRFPFGFVRIYVVGIDLPAAGRAYRQNLCPKLFSRRDYPDVPDPRATTAAVGFVVRVHLDLVDVADRTEPAWAFWKFDHLGLLLAAIIKLDDVHRPSTITITAMAHTPMTTSKS